MPIVLDNNKIGSVGDYLKSNIKQKSKLFVSSSLFTVYAFEEMREALSKIDKLSFLFNEPTFIRNIETNQKEVKEFVLAMKEREIHLSEFPYEIRLKNNLDQNNIAEQCYRFIEQKADVKSVSKSGAMLNNGIFHDHSDSSFLVSGNGLSFSMDGLGYSTRPKWDFNTVLQEENVLHEYREFINNTWNNYELVRDVKTELLSHIKNLYKDNSPEIVYYVTLYHLFHQHLASVEEIATIKEKTGIHQTQIWQMLYNFQQDAVIGAIKKLEQFNGCIIADSVGLGKTYEALAVIKYYELRNNRVLVLAPKKLRTNWVTFKQNVKTNPLIEDRFNYDVLNHTDLSREQGFSGDMNLSKINWGNYDLIVIDESHNFRNKPNTVTRTTRYEKLMEDIIKAGVKTKVLMLSATPVNNRLRDLKNQLLFITEDQDDAFAANLNIESINQTLRVAQQAFNEWSNLKSEEQSMQNLLSKLDYDFFNLLNAITIARSRRHIQKYYDTKDIGDFPERLKPKSIKTPIDLSNRFPSLEEINQRISRLHLAIYTPLQYILPTRKAAYDKLYSQVVNEGASSFSQSDREVNLVQLMRVNLLKRLESSVYSFGLTVERILNQVNNILSVINSQSSLELPEFDTYDDDELETYDFGKTSINVKDLDLIKMRQDLEEDQEILSYLLAMAVDVDPVHDAKLIKLQSVIEEKITNPINPNNKKIIVFTAFSDTAKYLYDNLQEWLLATYGLNAAIVTGSSETKTNTPGVRSDFEEILIHFSPRSSRYETSNEISLLIATDCISEGQNLQDCDYLVNYDIHWNPVRIIQRFGRIDRIGSKNKVIQLVNFWPNMELDEYINLESRVRQRMTMVDFSATGDDDLLNPISKDLNYRNDQLRQLQDQVIDLEDLSGGISLTDLTLDEFYRNLERFMREHPGVLENYPTGIHGIAPITEKNQDVLKEGIIFCLKETSSLSERQSHNALHPYHLVYLSKTGELLIPQSNPKKVLDYFQLATKGHNQPIDSLVEWFNQSTKNGSKMNAYTDLLQKAVTQIVGRVENEGIQSLFSLGRTNLGERRVSDVDDFELISFLLVHHESD